MKDKDKDKDKKPAATTDSDDESAASSDTDSFVHVEMGSTGTNSDSEWERVGSNHGASSGSDGDFEDDDEEEEEEGGSDDFDEVDFPLDKIPPVHHLNILSKEYLSSNFVNPSATTTASTATATATTTSTSTSTSTSMSASTSTSTSTSTYNPNNNNNNNANTANTADEKYTIDYNNYYYKSTSNNNNNNNQIESLTMSNFVQLAVDDDEDAMLAQALSLSLQEASSRTSSTDNTSSSANNNNSTATPTQKPKQDTLTARFEQLKISPEDPIDVIGVNERDVARLAQHGVYTVGQFAKLEKTKLTLFNTPGNTDEALIEAWEFAMRLVDHITKEPARAPTTVASATPASQTVPTTIPTSPPAPASAPAPLHHEESPRTEGSSKVKPAAAIAKPAQAEDDGSVWGYHYLAESVYEQIKEDRTMKSAYVLFHEYMECPVQLRSLHPWKRVYHAYLADAAKWNGARGKHKVENLTDTDVYAFLVWRSAESFAKFDVTAGPRAIYYSWTQMPMDTWRDTLEIDKIMGEDLRNPTICDRYARVIKINLSKLCAENRGVMHRVQMKDGVMDSNHWLNTSLSEAQDIKKTNLWAEFEPGSSFFSCVPHGCIVTPNGTIPWECIDTMESVNNAANE